jgi:hypothetical protein
MDIKHYPINKNLLNAFCILVIIYGIIRIAMYGYQFGQYLRMH